MRLVFAAVIITSMSGAALAQTQRTPPSAYATLPTFPSAFATAPTSPCNGRSFRRFYRSRGTHGYHRFSYNPTSPCYSGNPYPIYSAFEPSEFPPRTNRTRAPGAASLNSDQARARIEAKGYLNVSGLVQDKRGVWRGQATMKDGRSVKVILNLQGDIYSELSHLYRIKHPPLNCCL